MGKDKGRKKDGKRKKGREKAVRAASPKPGKMPRKDFDKELRRLQTELCRLQEWVKQEKTP